eukprot:TRINITY_DN7020_c0_g1_i9.p1 TRINITY_DN7020_c0_g1~~TRINITY_DN7020_c0_g1_i9.p1  ORF type:complete len:610 (-),score=111.92 TRINITY_DN7020_c0_g1_i9:136-1932(-)
MPVVTKSLAKVLSRPYSKSKIRFFSSSNSLKKQEAVKFETSWSYACGPGTHPLLGLTIGQSVDRAVDLYGDREGLVDVTKNKRRTFVELRDEINDLAAGFVQLGLQPGDRIGIWGTNTLEWYLTQFAAAKAGLVLVNINPAYQANELKYALNKVGVRAIVCDEKFKTQDYHEILLSVAPELDTCSPGSLNSTQVPCLEHVIIISEKAKSGSHRFEDILKAGGSKDHSQVEGLSNKIQMDSPANIQFTSGTTGNPKGVTLSHHNLVNNAYNIGFRIGYNTKPHRICVSVPLYHCFGNVAGTLSGMLHGATNVYPAPSFNGKACAKAIADEKCTSIYGTPTMFVDMLASVRETRPDYSHVETGIMAGAPCPKELCKNVISEMNMKDFCVCYGMTETSPVTFQGFCSDDLDLKTGTIGFPADHVEVAVMDDQGEIVPAGVPGELCTRGYSTMLGYWGDKEKTDEVIKPDRWFHTGDVAVIDRNGYGQIVGRMKDMIIRGGENIYPREVEEFLHTHPEIQEAQAFGVSDERMGEELAAWIKLNSGSSLTTDAIRTYCKGKLSHFKIPRYVKIVDTFPTTVTGKIQKFVMKDEYEKELQIQAN